ncbi:hypothetical protein [Streptomyces sp. NPDC096012]|uniref:hypothetical protein n=1 Tax=Streptomyces sp. NPDC096012 TaxID=3155684 RepID=UPI003369FD71
MRKSPQRHHAVRLGGFVRAVGSPLGPGRPRAHACATYAHSAHACAAHASSAHARVAYVHSAHACSRRTPVAPRVAAPPPDDVPDSTTGGPDDVRARRVPAYVRPPGRDRGVFDLGTALRPGGDPGGFRLVPQGDAAWAGGLVDAVDVRQ